MARPVALLALVLLPTLPGCASTPRLRTSLVAVQSVDHVDVSAREPMVVEHPSGVLFVAGYGADHPTLWASRDAGTSWSRVDVGRPEDGARGNSDVDLAVAPDGTLYFTAMTYDRAANEGVGIAVGTSHDAGATWRWTQASRRRFDDRPWVEVATDGTAHLIWNNDRGVFHRVSRDRGATWTDAVVVHDRGGSSHLAVGPNGELAVRVTPAYASYNRFDAATDLVAVSTDGGATWSKHAPPARLDWAPTLADEKGSTPRWVEPLAWDTVGRLYALYATRGGLELARSSDRGATWARLHSVPTSARAFFPYLAARGAGELAATWFTAADEELSDLLAWTARFDVRGHRPRLDLSEPFALESAWPNEKGEAVKDPAGEYLGVALLRDGSVAVVTPIQNAAANRRGFTFRRFRAQGAPARGTGR